MRLGRFLAGRWWHGPVYLGAAIAGALVAGALLGDRGYDPGRWPRKLTVIERPVPPGEQAEFLERLCIEGEDRGFRCDVGKQDRNLQPVGYVELWQGETHVTALAFAPAPLVRIHLFANRDGNVAGAERWLRDL